MKAKKIEIIRNYTYNWYFDMDGAVFPVVRETDELYWVSCEKGVEKRHAKVIEWQEPWEEPHKEPSYSERQAQWIKENDIKVGDIVRVTRPVVEDDSGCSCVSSTDIREKADMIGKEYSIFDIYVDAIWLWKGYRFPYTALEKVESKYRACKTFDEAVQFFGKGVKRKGASLKHAFVITGISFNGFWIEGNSWDYEQAFRIWEVLDGSPIGVKE